MNNDIKCHFFPLRFYEMHYMVASTLQDLKAHIVYCLVCISYEDSQARTVLLDKTLRTYYLY